MRMLAAIITLTLLGACGQTGPLYLPGEEPPGRSTARGDSADAGDPAAQPAVPQPEDAE